MKYKVPLKVDSDPKVSHTSVYICCLDDHYIHSALSYYRDVIPLQGMRKCEVFYREALRLRPNYTAAWTNLGLVLLNTGM